MQQMQQMAVKKCNKLLCLNHHRTSGRQLALFICRAHDAYRTKYQIKERHQTSIAQFSLLADKAVTDKHEYNTV